MNRMPLIAATATLLAGVVVRADVSALDSIQAGVSGLYQAVSGFGIALDGEKARAAAVDAVIRSIDARGHRLTESDLAHMKDEAAGRDYAIGVALAASNGLPVIVRVAEGSPAAAAGLQPGDVVTRIGSRTLAAAPVIDAIAATRSHGTNRIEVAVRRGDGSTNAVALTLALLQLPAVETSEVIPGNVGYIGVNGLYDGSGAEISSILAAWQTNGLAGAVLDLRGANGGSLADALSIATLFADEGGMLAAFRDRNDQDLAVERASSRGSMSLPVMALVDGETRGAAEVLAAVLKGSVRGALLIGTPTHGDPLIREAVLLPDGDFAYLAVKSLVTADGSAYDGSAGVRPDIEVGSAAAPQEDFEPGTAPDRRGTLEEEIVDRALRNRVRGDAPLRRAVDLIQGLEALNIRGVRSEAVEP